MTAIQQLELDGGDSLIFHASWAHRFTESISILSENYPIVDNLFFGIQDCRILCHKNTLDVGVVVIPDNIDFIPVLPYIGCSRAFK